MDYFLQLDWRLRAKIRKLECGLRGTQVSEYAISTVKVL